LTFRRISQSAEKVSQSAIAFVPYGILRHAPLIRRSGVALNLFQGL